MAIAQIMFFGKILFRTVNKSGQNRRGWIMLFFITKIFESDTWTGQMLPGDSNRCIIQKNLFPLSQKKCTGKESEDPAPEGKIFNLIDREQGS
jgi:hypothetical protein